MAFECPECGEPTLEIAAKLELPPDTGSDEIQVQLLDCPDCGFKAGGCYTESRRGARESWSHVGYEMEEDDWHGLRTGFGVCPAPSDKRCGCRAHADFNIRNAQGHWLLPESFGLYRSFPIRMGS